MASRGRGGRAESKKDSPPSLSQQGHEQIIEYLRLAEQSTYPEIRSAAVDLAKQTSKHELKRNARVSPTLILWVDLVLGVLLALGCWYAYLNYPEVLAGRVTSILIRVYLFIVAVTLLITGFLSQANFMKIISWFESQTKAAIKALTPGKQKNLPQDSEDREDK